MQGGGGGANKVAAVTVEAVSAAVFSIKSVSVEAVSIAECAEFAVFSASKLAEKAFFTEGSFFSITCFTSVETKLS